jgi:hypothetical protein
MKRAPPIEPSVAKGTPQSSMSVRSSRLSQDFFDYRLPVPTKFAISFLPRTGTLGDRAIASRASPKVGRDYQARRNGEAERLRRFEVEGRLLLGGRLHRDVAGILDLEGGWSGLLHDS